MAAMMTTKEDGKIELDYNNTELSVQFDQHAINCCCLDLV